MFADRAERLLRNVNSLREQLSQLREAHQSTLDFSLNRTMKTFTVLNAIFLPLSILVGWYGMNFDMPEFAWKYGYFFVIGFAVAMVSVCIFIFRKRHWM